MAWREGKAFSPVYFAGDEILDLLPTADALAGRGWRLDRQQYPASLHLTVTYAHAAMAGAFLADLAAAVGQMQRPGLGRRVERTGLAIASALVCRLPVRWVSRACRPARRSSPSRRAR